MGPNWFVPLVQLGLDAGVPYIELESCEGLGLRRIVDTGPTQWVKPDPAMIECRCLALPRNGVSYMTEVSLASHTAVKSHLLEAAFPLLCIFVSHDSIVLAQRLGSARVKAHWVSFRLRYTFMLCLPLGAHSSRIFASVSLHSDVRSDRLINEGGSAYIACAAPALEIFSALSPKTYSQSLKKHLQD